MGDPFPNTYTDYRQTWGSTVVGGLSPVLNYPNGLYSAPSATPLSMPGQVINDNPEFIGQPQTTTLNIAALSDDSQKLYDKGDFLFLFKSNRGIQENCYPTFAMWNLNYNLEVAFNYRKEKKERPPQPQDSLKRVSHTDRLEDWPVTISEFMQWIKFFGVFNTSLDKVAQRKRRVGVVIKGAVTIPNIFEPDEDGNFVRVGDTVYLHVGMYQNDHQGRMNINQKIEAQGTVGKFLQVKGHWHRGTHSPIGCSKFMEPSRFDSDFIDEMVIDQFDLPIDPTTRLVMTEANPIRHSVPLITDVYQQGFNIKLGRVVRTTKDPSIFDIRNALRSESGWKTLQKYSTLDIELVALDVDANI